MVISTYDIKGASLPIPSIGRVEINPLLAEGTVNRNDPAFYIRGDGTAFGWRNLQIGDLARIDGQVMVVDDALPVEGEDPVKAKERRLIFRPAREGDLNYRGQTFLSDVESEASHALPYGDPNKEAPRPGAFRIAVSPRTGQIAAYTYHLASKHWRMAHYGDCVATHNEFTQRDDDGKRTVWLASSLERKFGFEQEYYNAQVDTYKAEHEKQKKTFAPQGQVQEAEKKLEYARKERQDYIELREKSKQLAELVKQFNADGSKKSEIEKLGKEIEEKLTERLDKRKKYVYSYLRRETEEGELATNEERYERWMGWKDFERLHSPAREAVRNILKSVKGETTVDGSLTRDGRPIKVRAITTPEDYFANRIWNKGGGFITPGDLRWASNMNSVWDEKGHYGPKGRWVHAKRGIMAQVTLVDGATIYETVYGDTDIEAERGAGGSDQRDAPGQRPSFMVCWNGITWRDRQAAGFVLEKQESSLLRGIMAPIAWIAKTSMLGINAHPQKFKKSVEKIKKGDFEKEVITWSEPGDSRRMLYVDKDTNVNENTWIAKEKEYEIGRGNLEENLDIDAVNDGDEIEPIKVGDVYKTHAVSGAREKTRRWSPLIRAEGKEFEGVLGTIKSTWEVLSEINREDWTSFFRKEETDVIYARSKISPMWYISAWTASQLLDRYSTEEGGVNTPAFTGKRVVSTTRVWESEYAQARSLEDIRLGIMKMAFGGPGVMLAGIVGAGIIAAAGAAPVVALGVAATSIVGGGVWGQIHQEGANNPNSPHAKRLIPDELRDRKSEFAKVPMKSLCGISFYKQAIEQAYAGVNATAYSLGGRKGRQYADATLAISSAAVGGGAVAVLGSAGLVASLVSGGLIAFAAVWLAGKMVNVEKGEQQFLKYIVGKEDPNHPLFKKYKEVGLKGLSAEEIENNGLPFNDGIRNPTRRNWKFFVREIRSISDQTGLPKTGVDKDKELR